MELFIPWNVKCYVRDIIMTIIGAIITNHQRVMILRRVRVEDQGEYVCRAHNDRVSIIGSVVLSIQAR